MIITYNYHLGSSARQAFSRPRKGGTQREESPARGCARGHLSGAARLTMMAKGLGHMASGPKQRPAVRQQTSVIIWDLNIKSVNLR